MSDWPLDWRALVDEAIRRRKDEGLTQKGLAALADVSAPTVIAFERGDITLRLEKVFAILDAVGLVKLPEAPNSLASFIAAARRRWSDLIASLPADDPSRQGDGHSEQAYRIDGVAVESLGRLRDVLRTMPKTSGWTPFWVPTRDGLRPVLRDGLVECWLGTPKVERTFNDPASSDFWQVAADGSAFLQRGYQEDGRDIDPGSVFDLTLPIWRTAEVLFHAASLAVALDRPADTAIRFVARYTGLQNRELIAWAKPRRRFDIGERLVAQSSDAEFVIDTSPAEIEAQPAIVIARGIGALYERFDGYDVPFALIASQVDELRLAPAFERQTHP